MCERELETEQNCNILTPHSIGHNRVSFPVLLGCSTGGLGVSLSDCWFSLPHLIANSSDPELLNRGPGAHSAGCWLSLPVLNSNWSGLQTNCLPVFTELYNSSTPPSCGRHKLHSFNPSTVKATLCYSSTGCTCYLHRCISYFDSPAGS